MSPRPARNRMGIFVRGLACCRSGNYRGGWLSPYAEGKVMA